MRSLVIPGFAALALLLGFSVALPTAEARSVHPYPAHPYPAHGQMLGGVVVQSRTTIIVQHEVQAVQLMHYAYRGHRYAFGTGPLWSYHLDYCTHRFRSYNPHTNLFLAYSGGHHHCRSPYIQ